MTLFLFGYAMGALITAACFYLYESETVAEVQK